MSLTAQHTVSLIFIHTTVYISSHILVNPANQGRSTPLPKPRDTKPSGSFSVFSSPWHLGSQPLSSATFFFCLPEHSTCLCLLLLHLDIKLYLKMDKPKTISTFLSSCIPTCISPEISHSRKWNPCSSQNSGKNLLLFSETTNLIHQQILWVPPSRTFYAHIPSGFGTQGLCTSSSLQLRLFS